MSDCNFSHAVFLSRELAKDSPLHQSLQLRSVFAHCSKEGITTHRPLPSCAEEFVQKALNTPRGYPVLVGNLFPGEVSKFKKLGFDVEPLPETLPHAFFQSASALLTPIDTSALHSAGFSSPPSDLEERISLLRTIRVAALNSIRGA